MSEITVMILTFNEEAHIERCLSKLNGFANEIIILDSYSTDRTVDIAKIMGAKIFYRKFDNYSAQRKYLLNEIPVDSDWIFILDADEYLTEELKLEILTMIAKPEILADAYFVNRRFYWKDIWLKHSYYPTYILRFGRTGMINCDDRPINEHLICSTDNISYLDNDFIDHNLGSITDWMIKHNDYARREAEQLFIKDPKRYSLFASQYERKRWLRTQIWNNLPPLLRPFLYFTIKYFFLGGFLDGKKALVYHFMDSFIYRSLIDIKYLELKWENLNGRDKKKV
jgi:glycosyltransferase involved in cell wall biosynthesis